MQEDYKASPSLKQAAEETVLQLMEEGGSLARRAQVLQQVLSSETSSQQPLDLKRFTNEEETPTQNLNQEEEIGISENL